MYIQIYIDVAVACDEANKDGLNDIDSSDRVAIKHPSLTNIPIPRRPSLVVEKRPSISLPSTSGM
jgi:hypothetical protein